MASEQKDTKQATSSNSSSSSGAVEQKQSKSVAPAEGSPAHWDPIDPSHGNTSLVLLSKGNPKHAVEIAVAEKRWKKTGGLGKIVSIHRVQNLHLHKQYEAKKAELQKTGQLAQADARVYHGTLGNAPSLIHSSTVGFNPRLGRRGVSWFAAHASYSSMRFAHRVKSCVMPFGMEAIQTGRTLPGDFGQVFQARVTFDFHSGAISQAPSPWTYFSARDSAQCYPEYLITFQATEEDEKTREEDRKQNHAWGMARMMEELAAAGRR